MTVEAAAMNESVTVIVFGAPQQPQAVVLQGLN